MEERLDAHTRFGGYTIENGQLVSDRVQRIVQAIHDEFDGEVVVEWIPDRMASAENISQFKLIHRVEGQPDFPLFYVKNEEEFDEKVLLRLIQNDQRRTGQQNLSDFEAWEKTQQAINRQLYYEHMEQATDIAAHIFESPKNTYKVDNQLTVKEGVPFNANLLNGPKFYSHGKVSPKDLPKKKD